MRKSAALVLACVLIKNAASHYDDTEFFQYSDDELVDDALGDVKQVDRGRESFNDYVAKYVAMAPEKRRPALKARLKRSLATVLSRNYPHRAPVG